MQTDQPNLFDNVCTCGKVYGETCTVNISKCHEFLRYRREVEEKFNAKKNATKLQTSIH